MHLRRFELSDLGELLQLFYDTVHVVCSGEYTLEQLAVWAPRDADKERWQRILLQNITYIVEINSRIVGFGDLSPMGSLEHLYVHKDYQRIGIASSIAGTLIQEARQLGCRQVVTEASITAKPFFDKLGFIVKEKQEKEWKGALFTVYKMVKDL